VARLTRMRTEGDDDRIKKNTKTYATSAMQTKGAMAKIVGKMIVCRNVAYRIALQHLSRVNPFNFSRTQV
jgi:hypothetical protein